MARPQGLHVLHRLKEGKHEKIFFSETIGPRALIIWYVASPSGPLLKLFNLCPLGQKWPRPGGHMFFIHEKIFLSETKWPRSWIFCI